MRHPPKMAVYKSILFGTRPQNGLFCKEKYVCALKICWHYCCQARFESHDIEFGAVFSSYMPQPVEDNADIDFELTADNLREYLNKEKTDNYGEWEDEPFILYIPYSGDGIGACMSAWLDGVNMVYNLLQSIESEVDWSKWDDSESFYIQGTDYYKGKTNYVQLTVGVM